ncbi:hypothetical protein GCU60_00670 [Blastococcus saxobsidens]|uniref:Capsular polysaccharide biosynthesis protein n=1 Tax=Blastococcus saxobsidens TaxID=138336 RepID=A0A6L9VYN6_9ACTN|nr:hypothetical protein [Blastococcus saxobsidens]NEK84290.1 hypothetical protein [Blastococcus saxobsidens]
MPESSLPRILAVLRARALLIAVLAVPVVAAGFGYAATREPVYRSDVVVTFTPAYAPAADNSFLRLVRSYQLVATSSDALREAEGEAGLERGSLSDAVTVESPGDTLQLGLSVVTDDAGDSARAAEAIADVVVRIAGQDPLVSADLLIGPTEGENLTPLRQRLAVVAGLALAAVPGVPVALLLEGARPRVRVREDVAELGVPLLLSLRGRELRRWAADPASAEVPSGVIALRAELAEVLVQRGSDTVLLTSPDRTAEAVVIELADALTARGEGPAVLARPGLLVEEDALTATRGHHVTVLVLPAGTSRERAADCVELLGRRGAECAGAVLVR